MTAPHSTPLGRWNPTVKLATVLVVSTGALLVTDPYTPAIGWVLTVAALLLAGRVPVRTLALAHVPFLVFATSLLVVNVATRPGGDPVDLGLVTVGSDGLTIGAGLAVRTLLVGALAHGRDDDRPGAPHDEPPPARAAAPHVDLRGARGPPAARRAPRRLAHDPLRPGRARPAPTTRRAPRSPARSAPRRSPSSSVPCAGPSA